MFRGLILQFLRYFLLLPPSLNLSRTLIVGNNEHDFAEDNLQIDNVSRPPPDHR